MRNKFRIEVSDQEDYILREIKRQEERWFIEFYYKGKRPRYTYDLNRIKDLKKRQQRAILVRNTLEKKLIERI